MWPVFRVFLPIAPTSRESGFIEIPWARIHLSPSHRSLKPVNQQSLSLFAEELANKSLMSIIKVDPHVPLSNRLQPLYFNLWFDPDSFDPDSFRNVILSSTGDPVHAGIRIFLGAIRIFKIRYLLLDP